MEIRNFFFFFALSLWVGGCVTEKGEEPKENLKGYYFASEAISALISDATCADLAQVMDLWRSTNTVERERIRQKFFPDLSLYEVSDTIYIGSIYKINTFGSSILEHPWEVFSFNPTSTTVLKYRITQWEKTRLSIKLSENDSEKESDVTVIYSDDFTRCYLSGKIRISPLRCTSFFNAMSISIVEPIVFCIPSEKESIHLLEGIFRLSHGVYKADLYREEVMLPQEEVNVHIFSSESFLINYRGNRMVYPYLLYLGGRL